MRYLTSPEIQRVNAVARGYAPVQPDIYNSPALQQEPFQAVRFALREGAIARPSMASGAQYDAFSAAYFNAVHDVLTGEKSGGSALDELRVQTKKILKN